MEKYIAFLTQKGADLVRPIDPATVVTAAWPAYRCQYGCGRYGKSLCCPPHSPTWRETREILQDFRLGLLFRCHTPEAVSPLAAEAARLLFLDGYYKALAFGCGPCTLCKTCSLQGCRFPGKALPSMEACGIDVFATVRRNGLSIRVLREREEVPDCFGLLLVT